MAWDDPYGDNSIDPYTGSEVNYGDPGGSFPPDTPVDLGFAGSDTANPSDANFIQSLDGAPPDSAWTAIDEMNLQVGTIIYDNPDGSATLLDPQGYQTWVAPDGTEYPGVTTALPGGSVIQFSDGTVLDTNSGKNFQTWDDFLTSTSAGNAAKNGTGRAFSNGGGPGAGSSLGNAAKSASGAAAKPDASLQTALAALTKLGAGLTSLLSGTAKTVATQPATVASTGTNLLGGIGGLSIALVLGGIGLIIILGHKGG